jgi:hypothetical protein
MREGASVQHTNNQIAFGSFSLEVSRLATTYHMGYEHPKSIQISDSKSVNDL